MIEPHSKIQKSNNGKTSRYTYNASGERIIKSYGTMEGVYINGAPQGITFHETDNFTLYPASILTVNKNRFTKHYFIGNQRIASRIGTGTFNNVYGVNGSYITAGQQDYAERMNQIESQKEAYYKELGIAPGVPTEKGAYGDPENTGVGYNTIITNLGDHSVPDGWVQTPKHNTTDGSTPGTPISWNDPSNPDDPQAGYGYIANDTTAEETFFFHSDHLGSTSYITDDKGNITQYDAYLPYGELLVDEHSSSEEMPYKFNGKEFDEETGLYYYGARYMDPVASMWYGVDPLAEKYVTVGGFVYTLANPVKMVDHDGNFPHYWQAWIARKVYNLFHHVDASPIQENLKAKDPHLRYTYNTITTDENGGIVITNVSRARITLFSKAQKVGTALAITGYGLTLTGVGAEIGAPTAAIGNSINGLGTAGQLTIDFFNGDFNTSDGVSIVFGIGDFFIDKMINKAIPGVEAPSMRDITRTLYNSLMKRNKLNLKNDFDIGKEILKQGASLKMQGLELITNKAIEQEKQSQVNYSQEKKELNNK